jgi:hypothetical protein
LALVNPGVSLAVALAACSSGDDGSSDGGAGRVTKSDIGEDWPLTVDGGHPRLRGRRRRDTADDGTTYAVSGIAGGMDKWRDIDPIWADAQGPYKKNIGPLIQRGLVLCE